MDMYNVEYVQRCRHDSCQSASQYQKTALLCDSPTMKKANVVVSSYAWKDIHNKQHGNIEDVSLHRPAEHTFDLALIISNLGHSGSSIFQ